VILENRGELATDSAVAHTTLPELRSGVFEVPDVRARARDSNFAALYRAQRNAVLRAVSRAGVPPGDQDDAVQEVFIIYFRKFSAVGPPGVSPLLHAIAQRVGANYQRRYARTSRRTQSSQAELAGIALQAAAAPDEAAAAGEERAFVARALNRLPQTKREAVALADLEGLTMIEIAERTQVGQPTVASRLRVGRAKLAHWVKANFVR